MDTATVTGDAARARAEPGEADRARLVFIGLCDAPGLASASHALDDVTEVRFRRGARAVERAREVLTLAFPDSRMSSEHGRLVRRDAGWALDDPSSKNGSVVDGVLTRRALLADGAVLDLGRCFFVFRRSRLAALPGHLAGDVDATRLPAWPAGMATFSPSLAGAFEALARLAASRVSLVLRGETGTGKDVIARAIHALSGRTGELVAVNCGALPATLIEAELFGHRRGAFSGAVADRKGLVRSASGGTLFLDEVGELPTASQATLLRVLQERAVVPIGDDRPIAVDLRVIAATLCDLEAAIAGGRFRPDLYARLVGHVATLPPLHARREDLGLLITTMLAADPRGRELRMAPPAMRAVLRHDWPLNIRELEQVLAAAAAVAPGNTIELDHLDDRVRAPRAAAPPGPGRAALAEPDRALRDELVALFASHDGNVMKVARVLGKQRPQIYKWIKRLGIDVSAYRGGR